MAKVLWEVSRANTADPILSQREVVSGSTDPGGQKQPLPPHGDRKSQEGEALLSPSVLQEDLISVVKQSGLPVRAVQTWFRHRRAQDHPRLTKRFCEAR